ncbi:MAG TPA: response regulator [Candidatus Saccharimonadales bacterium]|nr:response regulator [Candidatus Saccharimonadales bacterium]
MTKIMLVEDDKSLREIYGVRLLAEGYDIVSAGDGEEALAMAIKERPKLIISDVMMPKISGFDMLDILRSTTETRDIKVIMMTALSSEDQRQRGEQMGADRYLVKSQVGIEDVVRVVHEVLGDGTAKPPAAPAAPPAATPTTPVAPAAPAAPAAPVAPAAPRAPTPPASATTAAPHQQTQFSPAPAPAPHPMPPVSSTTAAPPSARQRVIQPIANPAPQVDINELLNKELAREAGVTPPTAAQEKAAIQNQLNSLNQPGQQPPRPVVPPAPQPPTQHVNVQVPERPQPPQDK